jgi:hypothetical protein
MAADRQQLDRLLKLIDEHIDPESCTTVDERYRRALAYEETDRPPLVIQSGFGKCWALPPPWDVFEQYPYREAFNDPAAMLQNQLLDRVVPGLVVEDDNPLAIRNDHGTVQIASRLGGNWHIHRDDYPWIKPLTSRDAVRAVVESSSESDYNDELLTLTRDTLTFYQQQLSRYPQCAEAVQVSLPDLQGPMDTAEQLWGGDLLIALLDEPELAGALMARIVQVMLHTVEVYRPLAVDRLKPAISTQHGYCIPGQLLIRNDSSILVSPQTYREIIRPADDQLLGTLGGGSIHFCGNGEHLIEAILQSPHVRGIDVGESSMMDMDRVFAACRERGAAITNIRPGREQLMNGQAIGRFPTGVVFVYQTEDIDDAKEIIATYKAGAASRT